jgi:hypothetical protein
MLSVKRTEKELEEFSKEFLTITVDALVLASRACPEDAYVQRSAMNGLWWRCVFLYTISLLLFSTIKTSFI